MVHVHADPLRQRISVVLRHDFTTLDPEQVRGLIHDLTRALSKVEEHATVLENALAEAERAADEARASVFARYGFPR